MTPARKLNLDEGNPPSSARDQPMASASHASASEEKDPSFNDANNAVTQLGEGSSPQKSVSPSTPTACAQIPEDEEHVSLMNEELLQHILDDKLGSTIHKTDGR